MKILSLSALFGLNAILLTACSSSQPSLKVEPEWRLIPEATVLVEPRQFFLYGRKLDSATVTVPPSVRMEKGSVNSSGRVFSLKLQVDPLGKDTLAPGEAVGTREIRVKTQDTSLVFILKIVDEALPR